MTMASNNRNGRFNSGSGYGRGSFREHNQRMKAFRLTHLEKWRQWEYKAPEVQKSLLDLVLTVPLRGVVLVTYSPN